MTIGRIPELRKCLSLLLFWSFFILVRATVDPRSILETLAFKARIHAGWNARPLQGIIHTLFHTEAQLIHLLHREKEKKTTMKTIKRSTKPPPSFFCSGQCRILGETTAKVNKTHILLKIIMESCVFSFCVNGCVSTSPVFPFLCFACQCLLSLLSVFLSLSFPISPVEVVSVAASGLNYVISCCES